MFISHRYTGPKRSLPKNTCNQTAYGIFVLKISYYTTTETSNSIEPTVIHAFPDTG